MNRVTKKTPAKAPTNKTTRVTSITIPNELYPKALQAAGADRRPLSPWIVVQIERGVKEFEQRNVTKVLERATRK